MPHTLYNISNPASLECAICRSTFQDPLMISPCRHLFCRECLESSFAAAELCPLDRLPVNPKRDLTQPPGVVLSMLDEQQVKCAYCGWHGERHSASSVDCLRVSCILIHHLRGWTFINSVLFCRRMQAPANRHRSREAVHSRPGAVQRHSPRRSNSKNTAPHVPLSHYRLTLTSKISAQRYWSLAYRTSLTK